MAIDIGELRGLITLKDQFSAKARRTKGAITDLGSAFRAASGLATAAGAAITAAAGTIVVLGQRGAAVADVRAAFEALSTAAGGTADVMLGALREGVQGTLSDFDLMKVANKALGAGLVTSAADMETMAAGARALAKRTGGDTATAFETMTQAIASGRTTSLRQLGLFVDSKVATEEFAASLGTTIAGLSDAERAQALSAATLAALRHELEANAPAAADFGEVLDQAKAKLRNWIDQLAVAISVSPVLAAGLDAMGDAFDSAFGGDQEQAIRSIMGGVNDFAIGLTYAAEAGGTAATVIVTVWSAVKTVILAVLTAIASVGTGFVNFIAGLAELQAAFPGLGGVIDGLKESTGKLRDEMNLMTVDLAEQTAEAARGVAGQGELHERIDAVTGSIVQTRREMEAAAESLGEMGEAAGATGRKVGELGDITGGAALRARQAAEGFAREEATKAQAARAANDLIASSHRSLWNDMALLTTEGLANELESIAQKREEELAGLESLREGYSEQYDELVTLIDAKYLLIRQKAEEAHASIEAAGAAQGFQTRLQFEQTRDAAVELYNRMLASGLYTASTLQAAFEAMEQAKRDAADETEQHALSSSEAVVQGTQQIFAVLGRRYKAAAIAGAIIATYQAVAKALASAPWPANLILAAGALASGLANVQQIRNSREGWAEGTPGTGFVDFGRGSMEALHGQEAVVTVAQGESLAGMVGAAIERAGAQGGDLSELRAELSRDRRRMAQQMTMAIRDGMLLGSA